MSAYGTKSGKSKGPSLKSNTKSSTKKNNRGNGGNGGNGGNTGNGKNKKKKSDFETWLEKLFDWIEVRLDRIQRRIDLATAKAENAIGYGNKNSNIVDAMNEIAKSAADANSAVIYRNKNGAVTGYSGGTDGTKIGDSIRGALRYQQQADKVAQKARSKGIFKGADMDTIIDKIQTGRIDINEYTDKQKKFIEAYKEWYDKSQDLVQATEDLKKQYKELEQTKLDNIVDEFETLTGYAEAVKASSEATVDYYNSAGFAKNTDTDRAEIKKQQDRQNEITNTLINEIGAYKGELKNAEQIFGINSNEYREASTKLEEMNKSLIESQKIERELAHALYDLAKTVRGYFIDRVKSFVDKLSSIASLSEKRGTTQRYGINIAQTEDPYLEQTEYNNELILKYYEDIKEAQREIAKEGAQISSERYEELYKTITDGESAITSLLSANEDLKESIRTLRWKGYNEFQKQLDSINSDLEHLQGFIRDGDIMDDDAQFTKLGFAQIALIGEQMDTAEKKIRNAQVAIDKLGDEYKYHTISLEKYNEELDAQIDIIQDASGAMFDYQQKLVDMYIDQITAENDALQDLISARKDALSVKKEYYDYDKTLKSKNKDIAQLQAQINALNGVTNDAAKAKRAQLQAQLAEKQEDLDDTLYQHSIDLQQGGYDKLSEDMQKALDNAVKLINGDQKVLQQTAALMLQQLETNHIDEAKIIQGIVGENATTLHSSTSAVINELSGEGGVKKLLDGLGVKLGDIASLDIAGAINNRTPDASVSNIDTTLSTVKDSIGEDIGGKLREIELSIGTIKLSEEQKKNINDEIAKLEGINNKTSDIQSRIDELKGILDQSNKMLQTISGNTAKGDTNVGGNDTAPQPLITQNNIPANTVGQSDSTVQPVAPAQASAAQTVTTNPDPVMAAIETGTKRSKTITAAEKKKHHALWQYLVKNMGYAPTNDTYVKLAAALGVSIKNKKNITSAEKDKILNKLKKHEFIGSSKTEKANGLTPALNSPITTQPQQSLQSALTSTPAPAPAPAPAPVDPIIEAINTGASRSKTVTKAEKQKHGDLWEYVAKKYGRSLTEKIMVKLADLLNVNIAKRSNPTNAEKDKILNKLKKKNYAKGTKRVPKDLLAWTNENADKIGSEMIVRPSDGAILTPMKAGDSVIPANLADNLFKWGAISPDKFITNPFVGKWSAEGGSSVTNNTDYTAAPQTVEMHFDSLFHIEGNVDESVIPRLENLGKSLVNDKDFQKNVIKFVTKDFVRESKKQGIR